jgi:hypothetical protein
MHGWGEVRTTIRFHGLRLLVRTSLTLAVLANC